MRSRATGPTRLARAVRRTMVNDVADGFLLDVRGISLADIGSTALGSALDRLLSSNSGCNFNSFSSAI
jgi:hypothetical protein